MTAWENIAFALGKDKNKIRKTDEMLKIMDLYNIKKQLPTSVVRRRAAKGGSCQSFDKTSDVLLNG